MQFIFWITDEETASYLCINVDSTFLDDSPLFRIVVPCGGGRWMCRPATHGRALVTRCPKNDGYRKLSLVTGVTASDAETRYSTKLVDTERRPFL
jgi:hypothetical protein